MNKTDRLLSQLLTGDASTDQLLRSAFQIGLKHGEATDRDTVARSAKIDTTTRMLISLMRTQNMNLEDAMTAFCIPKFDREIYRRIILQRSDLH